MSLAALEHDKLNDFSARRLLVGYASAAVVLATVIILGIVFGQEIKKKALDEATPVVFTPPKVEPKAAPAKVEPPKPTPKAKSNTPPPLGRPETLAPKDVPNEAPLPGKNDPNAGPSDGVPGGSPDGVVGGTGTGGAVAVKPIPSAAPVAAPPPMAQSTDRIVPPRALSQVMPTFPDAARRAGVEVVVTVKYTVTEDGSVTDVVVVKGHPLLDAEIVRAVLQWRFSPATLEGRPVRVVRFSKLPFRPRS